MTHHEHERQQREEAHRAYITDPRFPGLEKQAAAMGFRKANLAEIHASADSLHGALDLYSWQGGLWIKNRKKKATA